jgi:hypothetical protein
MVHAACAFISNWPFQQQACIQQYNHHNNSGTAGTVYLENRTVSGTAHGRANPYTAFFLKDLPDSVRMSDEWYTWSSSPMTTNAVGGVQLVNKIMLMRLNESSVSGPVAPTYGQDHDLAWTHTQGKGITIYQSIGHDDTYQQDGTRRAYGDSLLWRQLRYLAKDWQAVGPVNAISSTLRSKFNIAGNTGSISLNFEGAPRVSVSVVDVAGHQVYSRTFNGEKSAEIQGLKRGIFFVKIAAGKETQTSKVTLY